MSLAYLLSAWVCVMIQTSPVVPAETRCIKVNSCKCIMKDGTGVIDLDGVGDRGGFLRPVPSQPAVPEDDVLLAFSPCLPLMDPWELAGTECSDAAACLIVRWVGVSYGQVGVSYGQVGISHGQVGVSCSRSISRYENYGLHEGSLFHYNDTTTTLSISYYTTAHVDRPMTIVHYRCTANRSVPLVLPRDPRTAQPLQVWVGSPCACANACGVGDLGLGTIFLIILIISATAYFILGSCALRAFRTSSGVQIAPEESVWCIMCYLLTRSQQASRGRQRPGSGRHQPLAGPEEREEREEGEEREEREERKDKRAATWSPHHKPPCSTMKALVYTLLACLLVSQLNGQQGKRHTCKCLDSGKNHMNPSLIHSVTVLMESNFCPRLEIV
ncbi:hypothetical protein N1851_030714 [Merluccius polli]|uniref:Uncharacterized protein n=1 Tax=Merluccius polli TaxID=89951 RepID=A0AA47M582_MERPO|nr:hypothetical protein N1851_030714 [Merluccius polli]